MMKTSVLMAAIVAGFGLVATGSQAQERPDFATLDADGDGVITQAELEAQAETRFTSADTDGDGALSEAELLAQATQRSEEQAARAVERMLAHLDENEDGILQEDELPQPNGRRAERFIKHADTDEDGAISEEEFEAAGEERGGRRGGGKHGGHRGERGGHRGGRG